MSRLMKRDREPRTVIYMGEEYPIRVVHYWKGRKFYGDNPFPKRAVECVEKGKCKRLTMASVEIPGVGRVNAIARCGPSDQPSRTFGRQLALTRLEAGLFALLHNQQ